MSQCFTQVNRDAAWCACLCKRKPEARLVQRFHLLYAGSSDLPTRQSGAFPSPAPSRRPRLTAGPAGLRYGGDAACVPPSGRSCLVGRAARARRARARPLRSGGSPTASAVAAETDRPRRRTGRAHRPAGRARRRNACARKRRSRRARRRTSCAAEAEQQARERRAGDRRPRAGARRQDARARRSPRRHRPARAGPARARDRRSPQHEQRPRPRPPRAEQLVAERQRELQRVAGLTADEARELLLKQIEADARRDAANLVKRLETEARETGRRRARSRSSPTPSSAAPPSTPSRPRSRSSTCRATT